jgi:hypothetical protein
LVAKLQAEYPLSAGEVDSVLRGLRQFWPTCAVSANFQAMPQGVVDFARHESFILHTRVYGSGCDVAFGKLLHHTPVEVLGRNPQRNDGLRHLVPARRKVLIRANPGACLCCLPWTKFNISEVAPHVPSIAGTLTGKAAQVPIAVRSLAKVVAGEAMRWLCSESRRGRWFRWR